MSRVWTTKSGARFALASLVVLGLCAGGCDKDAYSVTTYPDLGPRDAAPSDGLFDGEAGLDGVTVRDGCVPSAGGEVCDGKDNDCNGKIDDVPASKLQDDPKNCGACQNTCTLPFAFAKCQQGTCLIDSCAPGNYDLNKNDKDGCEYACVTTNSGTEICDNLDNDCNGTIDDNINFKTDAKNCGGCGVVCSGTNATMACQAGKCVVSVCRAGTKDLDGVAQNGCEYECPVIPPLSKDDCDGVDNDCNGKTDDGFVAGPCGNSTGECQAGTTVCQGGTKICQGAVLPQVEVCDGKDNDCDGRTDNGFDKLNDPRTCGGCSPCALKNAVARCTAGVCEVAACQAGYVDLDKKDANGCEYPCTTSGAEICDGVDNDCNGKIDDGVSLSQSICRTQGACAGAKAVCRGKDGWVCSYGSDVELLACTVDKDCGVGFQCVGGVCPGVVVPEELVCDGKDGDCDGNSDDPWSLANQATSLGQSCSPDPSKQGICQPKGVYACNATADGVTCQQTAAGKPATDELCNGLDDDCDGKVDESADDAAGKGVRDKVVHVKRTVGGKAYDFYVYAYEASRPDATGSSAGSSTKRACSRPGALPWAKVTYAQAAAACQAAGRRLCSGAEWQVACQGATISTYPYGNAYSKTACNGVDRSSGGAVAAGSLSGCQGGELGLYDMSGNLREWTSEKSGTTSGGDAIYVVRGGAYHTPGPGLSCTFTLSQAVSDVILPSVGFRCCSNTP